MYPDNKVHATGSSKSRSPGVIDHEAAKVHKQITENSWKRRVADIVKLALIILPQVVTLVAVSILALSQAGEIWHNSNSLQLHMVHTEPLRDLLTKLQSERGISCLFLSSDHWYTSVIDRILSEMQRHLFMAHDGNVWSLMCSVMCLLKAKDLIGMKRALGGSFFFADKFSTEALQEFQYISGGARYLFDASMRAFPRSRTLYTELANSKRDLIKKLEHLEAVLNENDQSLGGDQSGALSWFHNMTDYIGIITQIEAMTANTLIGNLQEKVDKSVYTYNTALVSVILVAILCPPLLTWYAVKAEKMQEKIAKFTRDITEKARELKVEKQKTDVILYQMLPVTIANDLRQDKTVAPEHFDEVTLYFSDIVGFTTLSGKSTPIEIIDLLNALYTSCDAILDRYEVYKVETIGDAYMVVSGLPRRIGNQHTDQICTMALDILQMVENFEIPHMPGEYLLMRIGIHSGPCAAGIVGTKMPRYCLFGDTVNVASRMESTGSAMRIHISSSTKENLVTHFQGFEIVPRGKKRIKGKGMMKTFWLLGKEEFPYRIDLEKTTAKTIAATYWRPTRPSSPADSTTSEA